MTNNTKTRKMFKILYRSTSWPTTVEQLVVQVVWQTVDQLALQLVVQVFGQELYKTVALIVGLTV